MQCHLDDIGVRHGSELSSLSRDCLGNWEHFVAPLRDQAFDLLQIGVGTGASLRTWREWFSEARLVGLDPRRITLDPPIAACTIVHGNQIDPAALQPLLRDHRFRLIVDDGSHHPDDQVQTFQLLFPWLEPDSVYICAGFNESAMRSKTQPEQPTEPLGQLNQQSAQTRGRAKWAALDPGPAVGQTDRPMSPFRHPARSPNRRTGPAWFAELGRIVATSERRGGSTLEQPMREFIRRKAAGVFLLPGSVVVIS